MDLSQLERLCIINEQSKAIRKQNRNLNKERKLLEENIKTHMQEHGVYELKSNDGTVTISLKNITRKKNSSVKDIIKNIEEETGLMLDANSFVTEDRIPKLSITRKRQNR